MGLLENSEVDRMVTSFMKTNKWAKIVEIGNELEPEERVRYLWAWPVDADLEALGDFCKQRQIQQITSIGCGTGMLEWIIARSCGLSVNGVEKDEAWWCSKHAANTYIPMEFTEGSTMASAIGSRCPDALLFCYFNDDGMFHRYMQAFTGKFVIIVGPKPQTGTYTNPLPCSPNFQNPTSWKSVLLRDWGSEDVNCVAIYERQINHQ